MKQLLLLLIALPLTALAQKQGVNSFLQLDATVAVFLDRVVAQNKDADSLFTLTKEELKKLMGMRKNEQELDDAYVNYLSGTVYMTFGREGTKLPYTKVLVRDTLIHFLEYRDTSYKVLTLYTYFADTPVDPSTGKRWSNVYRAFHFVVINDRLKLLYYDSGGFPDDITGNRMDYAEEVARRRIRDPQYKRFQFMGEFYPGAAVPFRKSGKWGFMSRDNRVLCQAVCDSVFSCHSGYTMIALNGGYNLLDTGYTRMFAKEVKTIIHGPFYFSSVGAENPQPLSFFKQSRYDVKLPPDFKASDSIRHIATAYLFSNDGRSFRPLKPYLEVSKVFIPVSEADRLKPPAPKMGESSGRRTTVPKPPVWEPEYALLNDYYTGNPQMTWWTIVKKTGDTLAEFAGWERLALWKDLLCGKKGDTTYVMDPSGKVLFQTHLYCQYHNNYLKIFDTETSLLGLYLLDTKRSIPVQYRSIQLFPGPLKVITTDYRFGFLNSFGEELFD